ncbi:MAG TPA: hypothetical protein VGU61_14710 [Noviherbaspirillum sp.]|jgi:hypothetical protein|uniref:hypothetical protein n=1 Tax=Noviherbaspirillum sp. TaxID=1926288 RepID=UPI002DDCAB2D|nr:hypothetical protein [Noviherbaspirillum sp.]HEV2611518.1 hypothetical protein [Noviherbaspirillum sp.]
MHTRKHLGLLLQGTVVWGAFWLAGLPAYYQQYSTVVLAVGSILLSVAISLAAVLILRGGKDENRMPRAFWLSFYYTVPFVTLDALYCGWYLGHGARFFSMYWYLTIFYVTPWLTFMPTAALLNRPIRQANTSAGSHADPAVF